MPRVRRSPRIHQSPASPPPELPPQLPLDDGTIELALIQALIPLDLRAVEEALQADVTALAGSFRRVLGGVSASSSMERIRDVPARPPSSCLGGALFLNTPTRRAYPMAMPALRTDWTVDQLRDLPDDGKRNEIINGVLLVSPSPAPVHDEEPEVLFDVLVWQPQGDVAPLIIDLVGMFRAVHGE